MIVAHLSDLHLGFRAYGRVERGSDVRERDVAAAFERATQELIRLEPALVVIAGDVFDRPDPPAGAVVALARGLEVLRAALPETPVLMVAGPRDTPRLPGDPGALAVFDTFPNVEAATGLTRSIFIERLDLHACLVPYRAMTRHPPALPEPDPRTGWNVLVLHAESSASSTGVHVDPSEWSYVALGGEHRRRRVAPRARYPGALERVALDPWDEAADEKGFLTADLDSGHVAFHTVPGRPVVALASVKVPAGDPERLRKRVREVTDEVPGGLEGKIVRLHLEGVAPAELLALQGEPLATLRKQALHLAVEADRALRVPPEAWLPGEAPGSLRRAVTEELERDGLLDERAAAVVEDAIVGDVRELPTFGDIDALDGEVAGLGRVSTSVPPGLTAVLGGGGRGRRALAELFTSVGGVAGHSALGALWSGTGEATLDGTMRRAIAAVAESRGLDLVSAALERLGATAAAEGPFERRSADGAVERPTGAVPVDPEQVAAEFRTAERELIAARADVAEIDGDLEVATMDWLRERQDAETTLQAYRDQARELRARLRSLEAAGPDAPCPTCGRILESHHQEVLDELRDQWESVVQDGSWWRSRWEQLELKPESLRDLEGSSLRYHAALEAGSERVELLRARLQDLDAVQPAPTPGGPEGAVVAALGRVRAARLARAADVLTQRASRYVCRVTGGRVLAVSWDGASVRLEGSEGVLTPLSEEDLAVGRLAIRLAGAALVAAGGRVLASLPIEEPFDRLDEEARIRTVELVRELVSEIPRVLLFTRGDVVDARPELFDYVLEVRDEGTSAGPPLRPAPAGPGRVRFKAAVSRPASHVG